MTKATATGDTGDGSFDAVDDRLVGDRTDDEEVSIGCPNGTSRVLAVDGCRPDRRLIDRCDSPVSHRSHNSFRSDSDNRSMQHNSIETSPVQDAATIPKPPPLWAG